MLAGMENTLGSTQCRCGRRLVHVDSAPAVCTYCRFLPAQCICQDLQDQPLEVLGRDVTPTEELAAVRIELKRMVELAEAAQNEVVLAWCTEQDLVDDEVPMAEAAFVAAASPERLARLAREGLDVLSRHPDNGNGKGHFICTLCDWTFPCPEVAAVLRAWQP